MNDSSVVRLEYPDPRDSSYGVLHIAACRLGCYVTAGRGSLLIHVRDGEAFRSMFSRLLETPDAQAAEIELGGEFWVFDSSVKHGVAKALALMIANIESPADLSCDSGPSKRLADR